MEEVKDDEKDLRHDTGQSEELSAEVASVWKDEDEDGVEHFDLVSSGIFREQTGQESEQKSDSDTSKRDDEEGNTSVDVVGSDEILGSDLRECQEHSVKYDSDSVIQKGLAEHCDEENFVDLQTSISGVITERKVVKLL